MNITFINYTLRCKFNNIHTGVDINVNHDTQLKKKKPIKTSKFLNKFYLIKNHNITRKIEEPKVK